MRLARAIYEGEWHIGIYLITDWDFNGCLEIGVLLGRYAFGLQFAERQWWRSRIYRETRQ